MNMTMPLIANAGINTDVFHDKFKFLNIVKTGVSGKLVKDTIQAMPGQRLAICRALGTTSNNISRIYARKVLNRQQSEEMLDMLSVYSAAYELYDDMDIAEELLNSVIPALNNQCPVDMLDTFTGRSMVKEMLNKMKWGEFT